MRSTELYNCITVSRRRARLTRCVVAVLSSHQPRSDIRLSADPLHAVFPAAPHANLRGTWPSVQCRLGCRCPVPCRSTAPRRAERWECRMASARETVPDVHWRGCTTTQTNGERRRTYGDIGGHSNFTYVATCPAAIPVDTTPLPAARRSSPRRRLHCWPHVGSAIPHRCTLTP